MKLKQMSKKLVAIGLSACMLLGGGLTEVGSYIGATTTVNAAVNSASDFKYETNDKGTITITGYKGNKTEVVIPSKINGKSVTEIGFHAFENCKKLKSVTIPNSVREIGLYAFYGCTGLTSVKIGNSVKSIDDYAFFGCTGLTSVTIPNSVTEIGGGVFENCTGLTSVKISNTIKSISSDAFKNCKGLKSVTIPNSVISIDGSAFSGCKKLTSITIPDRVTKIGYEAFCDCTGLKSIKIPNSVTEIGGSAFSNTAWYNNQPDGLVYAGKMVYKYKGKMPQNTSITLKNGTKGIAENAFEYCTGLKSITIPKSITSISRDAFSNCTGLVGIKIPDSVKSIGSSAFFSCQNLKSITIPDSVTSIGCFAFEDTAWYNNKSDGVVYAGKIVYTYKGEMPENTNITLKNGTKGIANTAFGWCERLKSITIPSSVKSIDDCAFSNCTGLTKVVIPDGVTSIGNYAFNACTGLKSVKIGNSVKSIGNSVFWGCTGLTSLTIGNSVKSIGKCAFIACIGLKSITIPNSVTSIGGGAFNGCTGLTNVKIGNGVKEIGHSVFADCKGLKRITIPSNVKSIGYMSLGYYFDVNDWYKTKGFTIYGVKGSAAEKYAKDNSMKFVAMLANTSKISKSTIYKGESITITGAATGGTKSYKYEMYVKSSSAKNWTKIKSYSTTAKKTWKPDKTGKYYIRVNVNDGKTTVSKTLTLNILSPLVNKSTVSKTNVKKGSTITLKAAATGGKSPYKYAFAYRNATSKTWKTVKSYSSSSTYNARMNKAGKYYFNIYVKDSTGKSVKKTLTVTVK